MNPRSYGLAERFVKEFVRGDNLFVCDIGSCDINGAFKPLFAGHEYVGLDIAAGPNVDVVTKELYHYPFENETFDVVISGSTAEHVQDIFSWVKEIARITKHRGLVCVICPSIHHNMHRHPVDCWRIYPDGMEYLLGTVAGLEMLLVTRSGREQLRDRSQECIGVGRKE